MLLDLPAELLALVARHLFYSSDRLRLASCCRRLWDTTLQEAYIAINVHYFCERTLRRLVGILIHTPDLAQRVTSISLAKSRSPPCKSHLFDPPLTQPCMRQSISDLIENFAPSDVEHGKWMATAIPKEECSLLGQDLWLTMLLHCVPNIQSLDMEWGGHTDISERFLTFISLMDGFNHLTEATIQVPFDQKEGGRFKLYKIAPFFRLQSLRKFKGVLISNMHDLDKGGFEDLVPSKTSPIEHIEMTETCSITGFMQLIRACRHLKSFTCLGREGYEDLPPGNYMATHFRCVFVEELSESLALAKDSLEHLCFDMYYPEQTYELGWFGSLTDYTKLRTLHLRLRDLLHIAFTEDCRNDPPTYDALSDTLPGSLEQLYVSDFDYPFLTGLRELENLVHAKSGFPYLRVIDIEGCWEHPSQEIYSWANPLRRACEEAGIEFNIRDYYIEMEHRGKPEVESEDHWSHQFGNIHLFLI
ncbi:hypothetical protein BJX96DRAFT_147403 [Aspergillus floccosus]